MLISLLPRFNLGAVYPRQGRVLNTLRCKRPQSIQSVFLSSGTTLDLISPSTTSHPSHLSQPRPRPQSQLFKYLATAPLSLRPPSPATLMRFSRSSPAVIPKRRTKSFAAVSRSPYPSTLPPSVRSSSGRPKYALLEMEVAPSNPWRRDLASACAPGSKAARPKNSSDDMPFCVPNLLRA